jgi:hypothetical protein
VPQHLDEVKAERLERIAKAEREIKARMQREINHWSRRYEELKLQEQAGKQVRLPAQVAKERAEVLVSRLEKRLTQLQAEAQITAKVPVLKGGALVIPAGLLLALQGQAVPIRKEVRSGCCSEHLSKPIPGGASRAASSADGSHRVLIRSGGLSGRPPGGG